MKTNETSVQTNESPSMIQLEESPDVGKMPPLSEAKSYRSEASVSMGCQTDMVSRGALDSAAKAYTRAMSTQYNKNDTPASYSFEKGVQCSTKPKVKNAVSCGTQTSLRNRNKA